MDPFFVFSFCSSLSMGFDSSQRKEARTIDVTIVFLNTCRKNIIIFINRIMNAIDMFVFHVYDEASMVLL